MKKNVIAILFLFSVMFVFSLEEDKVIGSISISENNQYYGFVFLEQNFLGLRKLLFVQSGYSTLNGLTGGLMYMDMNALPGDISLITGVFLTSNDDDSSTHTVGMIGAGKEFLRLRLHSRFKFDLFLFDNLEPNRFISNSFGITYMDIYYTSTIQTGTNLSVSLTPGWDFEESNIFFKVNSTLSYSKEILKNLFLEGRLSSQYFDSPTLMEEYWGGSDSSRTLSPVLCDQYAGGSILLEYAFFDFGGGAVSSLVQYELGGYQHNKNDWNVYTGPGAGLRLYLKKIAMPAIGLDIAYNTINNNFLFSFILGIKR